MRVLDAGLLVAAKPDRLFRDAAYAIAVERDCERLGGTVVYADGTSAGQTGVAKFTRTIMFAAAELERDLIRVRIKAAADSRKKRGLTYTGSPPFGYRNEDG